MFSKKRMGKKKRRRPEIRQINNRTKTHLMLMRLNKSLILSDLPRKIHTMMKTIMKGKLIKKLTKQILSYHSI